MSRVGNAPIKLPDGVDVSANGAILTAKGSKGELSIMLPSSVDVSIEDKIVTVKPVKKDVAGKSIWGTVRANINNMVTGVTTGFTRNLEINGVGYRAAMQGNKLQLNLGFSHPVEMEVPAGLAVKVETTPKSKLPGPINSSWVSLLQKFVQSVHLSLSRARA